MPKLCLNRKGSYYTRVPIDNSIATFQIDEVGVNILRTLGYQNGDNFEISDFWRLKNDGHTYTLGHDALTAEYYGGERLIVKPEGAPDLIDPFYGPGWIYDRRYPRLSILFRIKDRFKIIDFVESMYPYLSPPQEIIYTRERLIGEVSKFISKRTHAIEAVDCILESIKRALYSRDTVKLEGFGTLTVKAVTRKRKKLREDGGEVLLKKKWKIMFRSEKDLVGEGLYKVRFRPSREMRLFLSEHQEV